MINYSEYENIIFDFDGVIVNSNLIKQKCIHNASKDFCTKEYHDQFIEYFIKNNGIPREIKINKFFNDNESIKIINNYNNCLSKQSKKIKLTNGFKSYINLLSFYHKKLFVLSGGDQEEVFKILQFKELDSLFLKIMGGPKTKEKNIEENPIIGKTLFIGDSLKDYEIANQYGYDFIFLSGYTQFKEWKEFFKDKNILMCIKDFSLLSD